MSEETFLNMNSSIRKSVINSGKLGRKPELGSVCCIVVEEEYIEGKAPKYSSQITIGDGCTIKDRTIEYCVETMNLEEESRFIFSYPPLKECNLLSVCIFLTSFQEKPYIFQLSDSEKMEAANLYKAKGKELYEKNKVGEAFCKFSLSLKIVLTMDAVLEEDCQDENISNLLITLYNNLAGCQLYFENFMKVIKLCNNSIKISTSTKALYRRALAYIKLKDYEKAQNDLVELLKREPKNTAALEKYKLVRELDRANRENYKLIMAKMFSK